MSEMAAALTRWWQVLILAVLALAGCASTDPSTIRGTGFQPDEDEQTLWQSAARLDAALRDREVLYEDAALQQYLEGVLARVAPDLAGALRIAVVRDPYLNAFALPNGSLYVYTGMLASLENEAQLATLLGHEVTHYSERHALARQRLRENRTLAVRVAVGVLALAVAASGDANAVRAMLELGGTLTPALVDPQVHGYSRDLEREADAHSFARMTAAGYDPHEAPRIFEVLEADVAESATSEPFYYGSHPALRERRESYQALLAEPRTAPLAPDPRGEAAFAAALAALPLDAARADLAMGRAARAHRTLTRPLVHQPDSAPAHFLLGEALRRAENPTAARTAYARAAELDAAFAAPHRELGLLARVAGDTAQARAAFARYLALAPEATDRPIIEAYLMEATR